MKKFKYIFLLIGLSIIGCSDLEENPVSQLSPEGFFSSTNDIQTAVNATYGHMIQEQFWGRKQAISLMLRSDMVDLASTETERMEMNNLAVLTDNKMIANFWPRSYQAIAACNDAIAGAKNVSAADEIKNPVTAQAHFLRAFMYFHLVRQFGDIPYMETRATPESNAISKTPAAEVYKKIIADLEFAIEWLPNTTTSRAIPSKAAAHSYLALVYLTMAGNTDDAVLLKKAFDEANEVITNKGKYNLDLDTDFQNLFNANKIDASKEPIFALDYTGFKGANNGYDQLAPMTGIRGDQKPEGEGWSVAVPSLLVYTTWDANDYRRAVSLDDGAKIKGSIVPYTNFKLSGHAFAKNQPYIAKYTRYPGYCDNANARATSHNYSMIRYAEVLLIAAEASLTTNNALARTYINEVRARARKGGASKKLGVELTVPANAAPADLTGTVTLAQVLEERRLELAFEGIRWYDIARRKLGPQVFSAAGLEGAKAGFTDTDYLLPLPAEELTRNPNLAPNNPGY